MINTNSYYIPYSLHLVLKKVIEKVLCTDVAPVDTKSSSLTGRIAEKDEQ